jgi:hypothetical protein
LRAEYKFTCSAITNGDNIVVITSIQEMIFFKNYSTLLPTIAKIETRF